MVVFMCSFSLKCLLLHMPTDDCWDHAGVLLVLINALMYCIASFLVSRHYLPYAGLHIPKYIIDVWRPRPPWHSPW